MVTQLQQVLPRSVQKFRLCAQKDCLVVGYLMGHDKADYYCKKLPVYSKFLFVNFKIHWFNKEIPRNEEILDHYKNNNL